MKKCKNKAIYQYAWGSKIQRCCEEHARQIQAVANAIGSHVSFEPIITKELCLNVIG